MKASVLMIRTAENFGQANFKLKPKNRTLKSGLNNFAEILLYLRTFYSKKFLIGENCFVEQMEFRL